MADIAASTKFPSMQSSAEILTLDTVEAYVRATVQNEGAQDVAWQAPTTPTPRDQRVDRLLTQPLILRSFGREQATAQEVWEALYLHQSPLQEVCRGVLTTFNKLGWRDLVAQRDLARLRARVEELDDDAWHAALFEAAGLQPTQEPLDLEAQALDSGRSALVRLSGLNLPSEEVLSRARGAPLFCEIQDEQALTRVEHGLFAGFTYVVLFSSDPAFVPRLRALCSREAHLHLTHCWWPCTQQAYGAVRESLDAQSLHAFSFATVRAEFAEQLVARWAHARSLLARVLTERYRALLGTGWTLTTEDVVRDVALLFQCSA